jgi:hypothetical protein
MNTANGWNFTRQAGPSEIVLGNGNLAFAGKRVQSFSAAMVIRRPSLRRQLMKAEKNAGGEPAADA